jgi:ribosomal protein S18 acetylase RimI-like enzyme
VATISERAHRNLCNFNRFLARLDPAARRMDESGIVAVRGTVDWPSTRIAVREGPARSAHAFVDAIERFLLADGTSACVFARDPDDDDATALLLERGFGEYGSSPEMVCEQALEPREPPAGVTVRLATTADDVHDYALIAASAFRHLGFHEEATRATLDNPDVMLGRDVAVALADLDGRPVAGACSILVGETPEIDGYVGWVACLDDARGRRLGDVVTRTVTNEAFARGAGLVSLEASQFGESTYARMGYRELYRYRLLLKFA